jgi:hypothetical protein
MVILAVLLSILVGVAQFDFCDRNHLGWLEGPFWTSAGLSNNRAAGPFDIHSNYFEGVERENLHQRRY